MTVFEYHLVATEEDNFTVRSWIYEYTFINLCIQVLWTSCYLQVTFKDIKRKTLHNVVFFRVILWSVNLFWFLLIFFFLFLYLQVDSLTCNELQTHTHLNDEQFTKFLQSLLDSKLLMTDAEVGHFYMFLLDIGKVRVIGCVIPGKNVQNCHILLYNGYRVLLIFHYIKT